jgi:hypothetical protein
MNFLLEAIAEHLISVCPECSGKSSQVRFVSVPGEVGGGEVVHIECQMCKKLRTSLELSRDLA